MQGRRSRLPIAKLAIGNGCPTSPRNAKLVIVKAMEETARAIATKLRENNHIAFFAGGCVRDMVRKLPPKDIDIATDARPEEVQKLFPRTYAVGAHFGVIVVLENGFQFEVATFRSDDGRPTGVCDGERRGDGGMPGMSAGDGDHGLFVDSRG